MFKRMVARILCGVMLFGAVTLGFTSCGKDELGNRYSSVTEGMEAADALVDGAKEKSDLISDIEYDIALMIHTEYDKKVYDLGIKNSYYATDRNTENSEIYCSKIYYGANGNTVNAYYRHNGNLYVNLCNTLISAPISEKDFYGHVETTPNTAELDFFKSENFATGKVYTYSDGTMSAVYEQPSAEFLKNIAGFLGLEGAYAYDFSQVYLRCNVKADGTVSECRLDFIINYYDSMTPTDVVTYDGEFACTVKNTGDAVTVKKPQSGLNYTVISDYSRLELLTKAYGVLAEKTSVSADYYRKIVNSDSKSQYQLETNATFTQSYHDKVYKYGSIDVEKSTTSKRDTETGEITTEENLTSVGIFAIDGKYYYRDLENNDKTEDDENTPEQWLATFAATLTEEAFFEDDLSNLQISEEGDIITFTYSYDKSVINMYAEYLLEAFTGTQGSIDLSNQIVNATKNKGVVKIRISDGCLIYHSVEFEANIAYSIDVSGSFELKINATEDVDVLDLQDWEKHEMRYN